MGSALFAAAPAWHWAAAGRTLVGVGVSVTFIALLKLTAVWFPPNRFATVNGVTQLPGNLGASPASWRCACPRRTRAASGATRRRQGSARRDYAQRRRMRRRAAMTPREAIEAMLAVIDAEMPYAAAALGGRGLSARVREAIRATPRHAFIPGFELAVAYGNYPLPIGFGATISQPFIVALMTELLALEPHHRVLEVGTGSGWQAAVLAQLASQVCTVEIVPELAAQARTRLRAWPNVEVRLGDGREGWPERAPFDGILVAAATPAVPPALLEQLAPGGRLVLPLGRAHAHQELVLVQRDAAGELRITPVLAVAFVPLTGG